MAGGSLDFGTAQTLRTKCANTTTTTSTNKLTPCAFYYNYEFDIILLMMSWGLYMAHGGTNFGFWNGANTADGLTRINTSTCSTASMRLNHLYFNSKALYMAHGGTNFGPWNSANTADWMCEY